MINLFGKQSPEIFVLGASWVHLNSSDSQKPLFSVIAKQGIVYPHIKHRKEEFLC